MVNERLESDRSSGWLGEEKLIVGICSSGSSSSSGRTGRRRKEGKSQREKKKSNIGKRVDLKS